MTTTPQPASSDSSAAPATGKSAWARAPLYGAAGAAVFLFALLVGVYVWKVLAVRGVEQRRQAEFVTLTQEKAAALTAQRQEMLRLAAIPLAWAVRAEMLRDKYDQVDEYLGQFVHQPGVRQILLVGADGNVRLSTDRKRQGQPAAGLVSDAILSAGQVVAEEQDGRTRMGVPIMGLESRLGVLVLDYGASPAAALPQH